MVHLWSIKVSTMTPNVIDFDDGRTFWLRGEADLVFVSTPALSKNQLAFRSSSGFSVSSQVV